MQLTKLDRWLKERFIYETHIFTLRLPEEGLPTGVVVKELEENKGGDYRHRLIIQDNEIAEQVIGFLKQQQIMHATHIVEGKHWYNQRIAPTGRSFTFQWLLRSLTGVFVYFAGWGVYLLSQNEELMNTLKATIEELKSGM